MLPSNPTPYTLLLHEPQSSSYDCLLQMHPCSDIEFQHSRGALPRNSIHQSLQIDPACQNPSLNLPVAQTLAMNTASQSSQDWGKQNPAGGRIKKSPSWGFFVLPWFGFFLATPTSLEKNTSQAHIQPRYRNTVIYHTPSDTICSHLPH